MKRIEKLIKDGFSEKWIVAFLIGYTENSKLSIGERVYLSNYIEKLEASQIQTLK